MPESQMYLKSKNRPIHFWVKCALG